MQMLKAWGVILAHSSADLLIHAPYIADMTKKCDSAEKTM